MTKREEPMNDEATENINFQLEVSLKKQLQEMADQTERSMAGVIRLILKQHLDGKGTLS